MAFKWFRRKENLPILATCPSKCSNRKLDSVEVLTKEDLIRILGIAGNFRLHPDAKFFHCRSCGTVWQRTFDTDTFRFHSEVFGTIKNLNATQALCSTLST